MAEGRTLEQEIGGWAPPRSGACGLIRLNTGKLLPGLRNSQEKKTWALQTLPMIICGGSLHGREIWGKRKKNLGIIRPPQIIVGVFCFALVVWTGQIGGRSPRTGKALFFVRERRVKIVAVMMLHGGLLWRPFPWHISSICLDAGGGR